MKLYSISEKTTEENCSTWKRSAQLYLLSIMNQP